MAEVTAAQEPDDKGATTVLVLTAICMMVVGFNTTAVATVLPNLKSDLDLTPSQLQWVMAVYTVVSATLVLVLSRLGDISGKLGIFILGMVIFAIGSTAVMLATGPVTLLAGRGAQGAGAAALFGTSLSLLTAATPEPRRAGVVGIWGAIVGLAMSLGPIVGGAFAHFLNWRGIFALDLALLGIAFILALSVRRRHLVPDTQMPGARLDLPGALAILLLLGPLSFALSNGESQGWLKAMTLGPMVIAVLAFGGLIYTARRSTDPLIELRYFRHPRYVMAAAGMGLTGFALFCFFVFFSIFVQSPDALAFSPIVAGFALLPLSASLFFVSIIAPRVLAPYNFRWPICIGMAAMAIGFILLATTDNTTAYGQIWWKLVIVGCGIGICFSLFPRLGMRLLPDQHSGQGSGVINTCLYFGATLGAVLGGLAVAITTRAGLSKVIAALPAGASARPELSRALAHGSPSDIQQILSGLDPGTSKALAEALRDLQDNAFDSAVFLAAAASAIGCALTFWLMRGPVPPVKDATRFTEEAI
ncbi:MAG: MFS transporter [Pseudomonadota bacterium]